MRTKIDLVHYLHRCAFSPAVTTWTKAIYSGYFTTWPGLTSKLVRKHITKFMATSKGHLRQYRQNVRSTKTPDAPPTTPDAPCVRTHELFAQTIQFKGKKSTYQTDRFLVTSSRVRKYIMVLYDQDSNAILTDPMKSRSEQKRIRAYSALHSNLTEHGLCPNFQILDNECPASLKYFMRKEGVTFQLIPPHLHRTDDSERAIQTFKYHFVAALRSCYPEFTLHIWDRLSLQATFMLNLLHTSRINPCLSSEAQLGAFDFNKTPLTPPGTNLLIFETSTTCRTWAPHGIPGWYLGTVPKKYCRSCVYVLKTRAERVAKTV